jgi:hypothetical protein
MIQRGSSRLDSVPPIFFSFWWFSGSFLEIFGLTGFRNYPDQFLLPAARSCCFPLHVSSGCWLCLAPRSSGTPVAMWIWQEKLVEVFEWNWVHMPNSWVEFLSAPIHSPLSGSPFRSFKHEDKQQMKQNLCRNRRRSLGYLPLSSRCNKYNSLCNKRMSPGYIHCRRGTRPGNLCLKIRFLTVLLGQNRNDQNTSLMRLCCHKQT